VPPLEGVLNEMEGFSFSDDRTGLLKARLCSKIILSTSAVCGFQEKLRHAKYDFLPTTVLEITAPLLGRAETFLLNKSLFDMVHPRPPAASMRRGDLDRFFAAPAQEQMPV
jgi:hypothetical protein